MKNPNFLVLPMEKFLPVAVFDLLRKAGLLAETLNLPLWLVGGSVRDILLGHSFKDLDIMVEGDALVFAPILAREIGGRMLVRSQFGTARLEFKNWRLDLTSARSETYDHPGSLPNVKPGRIYEDLARRDFTINAMAIALGSKDFGKFLDPFHGRDDLSGCHIRILHSRSFVDDATRILRAIRYENRLGFHMVEETECLVREGVAYLRTIGSSRIRHELELVFKEPQPSIFLSRSRELGVLQSIYASLIWPSTTHEKLQPWLEYPKFDEPDLYIALLVISLSIQERKSLIKDLAFTRMWRRIVEDTTKVEELIPELTSEKMLPSEIYHLLHGLAPAAIKAWMVMSQHSTTRRHLLAYWKDFRLKKPSLNGNDIVELGVPSGPSIGELLIELNAARLDGLINTVDEERQWVLRSQQPA